MLRITCRLLFALLVAFPAAAVTLTAGVDTFVRERNPDTSYDGGVTAEWDGNDQGGPNHALIYFPLFQGEGGPLDAAAVAASPTLRATLQFDVVNQGDGGNFHRLNLPGPIDGSETWNSLGGSGVAPGVNAVGSADLSTPDMGTGTYSYDITASIQAWAASPGTNTGWGIVPTGNNGLEISTFESGNGPQLTVVEVSDTYVPMGSSWNYYDLILPGDPNYPVDGSTLWYEPGFDDSSWAGGAGQLGYGDGDESTSVAGGNITYLFRTTFLAGSLPDQLEVDLLRDDSAIVYLNGVEVIRDNLPGTVDASTIASSVGTENGRSSFSIDPLLLNANGLNTLAVEIHNVSTSSSDISFDLALLGLGDAAILSAPVPEPTTGALVGLGLVVLAVGRRRR